MNPWEDRSTQRFNEYYQEFLEEGAGEQAEFLAMRQMCLSDLGFLAREIYGMKNARDRKTGRKRWYPPIHEPFCDHLQRDDDGLYHLSRGMMKTSIVVIWIIQKLIQDPALIRIGLWSQNAELVQKELKEIKAKLEVLAELFPDVIPPRGKWSVDNADALTMTRVIDGEKPPIVLKENQIEVFGVLKSATGRHFDIHVYDDVIDDSNVTTAEQIDKVRNWWAAVQAIKESSAVEKIVGTPWHHMDLYATIHSEELFTEDQIFIRAGVTEDMTILYPFFTKEEMRKKKTKMGPQLFAAQYCLQTRPREDRMFVRPYPQYEQFQFPSDPEYYISVDPSLGKSKRHDKTGICVAAISAAAKDRVFFVEADGYVLDPEKLADMIIHKIRQYHPRRVGIEYGLQLGLEKIIRMKARLAQLSLPELLPIKTGGGAGSPNKADKINRTIGAMVRDQRALFLPRMHKLFKQMDFFNPNSQKNDDDILDSAGMMIQTIPYFAQAHWYGVGEEAKAWQTWGEWEKVFFPQKKGTKRERVFAN